MLRQSGISGSAGATVINDGVTDTGPTCDTSGISGAGNPNNPDPTPLRFGDIFTLTTSTDWIGTQKIQPGESRKVYGIELGRGTYLAKSSLETSEDACSATIGGGTALASVMTEYNYWGYCQWRLVPTDASMQGRPVQFGRGSPFKIQYVGENPGMKNKYMQVGSGSDSYYEGAGFEDGVFVASMGSPAIMDYTRPLATRAATGNVVYLGDEFRLDPINGYNSGKQRGWGMAIEKAWEGHTSAPTSGEKDADRAGHPREGYKGSGTVYMVGNFGEMDHSPVPMDWSVWPPANQCDSSWSTSNWGNRTTTNRFRAYPSTGPTARPPALPNSCKCNFADPDGQQRAYRGAKHREWCASAGDFAQCKFVPGPGTPAGTPGTKTWQWVSCADVESCRGERAMNVCGNLPSDTSCPGATSFCCDTASRTWRCRARELAPGISFSCPLPGTPGWDASKPRGACANNTELYTCLPTGAAAMQSLVDKGGMDKLRALGVKGSYVCAAVDAPVFLCPAP